MDRATAILLIIFCVNHCFAQKQIIITGTIKNFYAENSTGKLGIPFAYYNPKSEQYENHSPMFQTSDSFYFKFNLDQPKLFNIFFRPIYLVPGDSVHLHYTHSDEKGNLTTNISNEFSKLGFDGNITVPSFIANARDSIKIKLYKLKGEKNINKLIDSVFADLLKETLFYIQDHKISDDYREIIESDIALASFTAKVNHFINGNNIPEAIQLISKHLSYFKDNAFNTLDYFYAIGSVQEAFSAKYHYNDPQKVLTDLKKYLKDDNYIYASLIFSNVLRQQLPSYNNPYSINIALNGLENTNDIDLIIFANFILNQENVNENANELLKDVKIQDYYGNITTIGQVLKKKTSKLKFIDLWASWCAPCIEGIPFTIELPNKFKSENIKIFFISTDKNINDWKSAVKRLDLLNEESYCVVDDSNLKKLEKAVYLRAIPQYLLLDSANKIQVLRAPSAKNINIEFLSPFLQNQKENGSNPSAFPPPPPPAMKRN